MRPRHLHTTGVTDEKTHGRCAGVVELADTPDLGSGAARFGGSSPPSRISQSKGVTVQSGSARNSKSAPRDVFISTVTPLIAIIVTCLTGCWGDKASMPRVPAPSCFHTTEDFAANAQRAYDYFKGTSGSDWRASLEAIRDARGNTKTSPRGSSFPLLWEEGDRFPSVRQSEGRTLRLTPIMNRHKVKAITRVSVSHGAQTIAVIAHSAVSPRQILLIIDTRTAAESKIDIDAYDILWIDSSTLLVSERVNYEPRAVFSLRVGEPLRKIVSIQESGEALLLRPSGREGYGLIEHSHPRWSFFEVINSSAILSPRIVTSKDMPGSDCSILESSIFCSSFITHPKGSIARMALRGGTHPRTVYVETSGGAISDLAPSSERLAIFTSHGSYSTISVISSDGALITPPTPGEATTTLVPASRDFGGEGSQVTRRSFMRPSETITIDDAHIARSPQRASICDECVARSLTAVSLDGTSIPISLVTPSNPRGLLVNAYGSYGVTSHAEFTPEIASLTRQGVAVALVHVRGGGELGPSWHSQARGVNKTRSVEDLSASVSELSGLLKVPARRVIVHGRSAGAWLAAKIATLYSEKIGGLILEAPLLDLERVVPDKALPLFERERHEWSESPHVLRVLSPNFSRRQLSIDLLAQVPLRDQLVPPDDTLRWVRDFQCHQTPGFETIVSLLPGVDHSGPASRAAIDEWSVAQEIFIKRVIEKNP
jgi:hypothetical protein